MYWDVVLFALTLLIFVTCAIEQTPFRAVVLATQAAVLCAFVGFVFLMDQPFKGQNVLSPDPLVQGRARRSRRPGRTPPPPPDAQTPPITSFPRNAATPRPPAPL